MFLTVTEGLAWGGAVKAAAQHMCAQSEAQKYCQHKEY